VKKLTVSGPFVDRFWELKAEAEDRQSLEQEIQDEDEEDRRWGGNGGSLPVRSSVAAFYRWNMSFESSGQSSGGRVSRPLAQTLLDRDAVFSIQSEIRNADAE